MTLSAHDTNETAAKEAWLGTLDEHAMEHGFHARLGVRHGALYTEDDESLLLVSFENADDIRASEPALPYGLKVAGKEGWSQLTFYSEGQTWFRDPEVFSFVDDLVDDGFFDLFDNVLFYGAGSEGYAACAFSVASPGARVLAIRPHATQDPALAGWDKRFPAARRLSFDDRYGFAPKLLGAAANAALVYDPRRQRDAMHAALYGTQALHLRTPFLGEKPEADLDRMGVLEPLLRLAAKGQLDQAAFAKLYRKRREHSAYLRRVISFLSAEKRPWLQGLWCRAALKAKDSPRIRKALDEAEAALAEQGRRLPPAHDAGQESRKEAV